MLTKGDCAATPFTVGVCVAWHRTLVGAGRDARQVQASMGKVLQRAALALLMSSMIGALLVVAMATEPVAGQAQDGALCTLMPLTLPLFGGTPVAVLASPATSAPTKEPVDGVEVAEALDVIVACVNTGDPKLVYAIFAPSSFARAFSGPRMHYQPAFERMLDASGPTAAEPLLLGAVEEIEPLPDGRVAVVATFASGDATWRDRLVLARVGDHWLIDEAEALTGAS